MEPRLHGKIVVITGASSGIGRATAQAFAERGAVPVLAARSKDALAEAAEECRARGAEALAVPLDVRSEADVEALAEETVRRFGRIDVWINNAAVSLFGRLEEVPSEDFRRVVDTNLFGCVNGARAAVRRFRAQGYGTLMNVSSLVSYVGQPYTSAYVASKFAIRGLGECLRQELRGQPRIHVVTVLPGSTDTPLFQSAGNYSGRTVRPMSPLSGPERVAETIVAAAVRPKREAFVGGHLLPLAKAIAPATIEALVARKTEADHFQDLSAAPSRGNLYEPSPQAYDASGGWRREPRPIRMRTLVIGGLALGAFSLAAAARSLLLSRRSAR